MTRNMSRQIRLLLLGMPLFALAACGTPQENCIRQNTSEYRAVRGLLAQTEANLERGYGWAEREVTRTELRDCRRLVRDRDGNARVVDYSCWRDVTDTERYRVAIDPLVETRKRDNLREKLAALTPAANAAVAQCRAAYPEE